ncbi:MAG: hypothetical protein ABIF10_03730 [Candidatus Woesearchaeota archaeon]
MQQLELFEVGGKGIYSIDNIVSSTRPPKHFAKSEILGHHYSVLSRLVRENDNPTQYLNGFSRIYRKKLALFAEGCGDVDSALIVYDSVGPDPSWNSMYLRWVRDSNDPEELMRSAPTPGAVLFFGRLQRRRNCDYRMFYNIAHKQFVDGQNFLDAANLMFEIRDFPLMLEDVRQFAKGCRIEKGLDYVDGKRVSRLTLMARTARKEGFPQYKELYGIALSMASQKAWYGSCGRIAHELGEYGLAFNYYKKGRNYLRALGLSQRLGLSGKTKKALTRKALEQKYYLELIDYPIKTGPRSLAKRFGVEEDLLELYLRDYRLNQGFQLASELASAKKAYLEDLLDSRTRFREQVVPKVLELDSSKAHLPKEVLFALIDLAGEPLDKAIMALNYAKKFFPDGESFDKLYADLPQLFPASYRFQERELIHIVLAEYFVRPCERYCINGPVNLAKRQDVRQMLKRLIQLGSVASGTVIMESLNIPQQEIDEEARIRRFERDFKNAKYYLATGFLDN